MSNIDILNAIEEENLGSVRQWLNSSTGRANINKVLDSGQTVLNRALSVASNYKSRNTFAHRIVNLLREHGAQTANELVKPPPIDIFAEFNYSGPNIFSETPKPVLMRKPPLVPKTQQSTNQSRRLNGIAFGPQRNKRNSRRRRATRRRRNN